MTDRPREHHTERELMERLRACRTEGERRDLMHDLRDEARADEARKRGSKLPRRGSIRG